MSITALQAKSASAHELVLPLQSALEAIDLLERSGTPVLGWEGWLRYEDGRLGHSAKHQGTAASHPLRTSAEFAWVKSTMQASHDSHSRSPEAPSCELLFCITPGA